MADLTAAENPSGDPGNGAPGAALTGAPGFRIAEWTVEPALSRMTRDADTVRLEPKVMAVLVYLAERPGQAVGRRELEDAIWAGTIVSYDALTGAIQKLRKAFDDDPRRPQIIETLSKKGYRLVAPVTALEDAPAIPAAMSPTRPEPTRSGRGRWVVVVLLLTGLAAAAAWIALRAPDIPDTAGEERAHSIAVLPFDNLSADPEQDYFADGMTDDLITALAKHPEMLVISRDSTFQYKG